MDAFGIVFNSLFCLNNMPIKRYVDYLQRRNKLEEYMQVRTSLQVIELMPLPSSLLYCLLPQLHVQLT